MSIIMSQTGVLQAAQAVRNHTPISLADIASARASAEEESGSGITFQMGSDKELKLNFIGNTSPTATTEDTIKVNINKRESVEEIQIADFTFSTTANEYKVVENVSVTELSGPDASGETAMKVSVAKSVAAEKLYLCYKNSVVDKNNPIIVNRKFKIKEYIPFEANVNKQGDILHNTVECKNSAEVIDKLPKTVEGILENDQHVSIPINWIANTSYDATKAGNYTFNSEWKDIPEDIIIPTEILPPSVDVSVKAGSPAKIKSYESFPVFTQTGDAINKTTQYKTAAEVIGQFPKQIDVVLEDGITTKVEIEWLGSREYDPNKAGDYVFTSKWKNLPSIVCAEGSKEAPTRIVKVEQGVLAPSKVVAYKDITFSQRGDAANKDVECENAEQVINKLPRNIEVTLENGYTVAVDLLWQDIDHYDAQKAGEYKFKASWYNLSDLVIENSEVPAPIVIVRVEQGVLRKPTKSIISVDEIVLDQTGDIANNNVQYTTAKDVMAALPSTATVRIEGDTVVYVPISWEDTSHYDSKTEGEYIFTSKWDRLPVGVNNNNNMQPPRVIVHVRKGTVSQEAPKTSKIVKIIDEIKFKQTGDVANNSVQYQTVSDVQRALPQRIIVELANKNRASIPVTWKDNDGYNAQVAKNYTFTAVWGTLPAGVNNSGNILPPIVTVNVAAGTSTSGGGSGSSGSGNTGGTDHPNTPGGSDKPSQSSSKMVSYSAVTFTQTGTVLEGNVQYQTAAAIKEALPKVVSVTLANAQVVEIPVSWEDTDHYNAAVAGKYRFKASWGTLPKGVDNSGNLTAPVVEVVVKQGEKGTVINGFDSLGSSAYQRVDYGTNRSSLSLPAVITARTTGASIRVEVKSWKESPEYDKHRSKTYTFTPEIALPQGYTMGAGVKLPTIEVYVRKEDDDDDKKSHKSSNNKRKDAPVVVDPNVKKTAQNDIYIVKNPVGAMTTVESSVGRVVIDNSALRAQTQQNVYVDLYSRGSNIVFSLNAGTSKNTAKPITKLNKPVKLCVDYELQSTEDRCTLTMYKVLSNGNYQNIGGTYIDGQFIAKVDTTGEYKIVDNKVTFYDVTPYNPVYASISSLAAKGYIQGVAPNEFGAERPITKTEFTSNLVKVLKLDESKAKQIKTSSGQMLTREEMLVLVAKACDILGIKAKSMPKYCYGDDEQISGYAAGAVQKCVALGLAERSQDLKPGQVVTRGEMAQILDRLMSLTVQA